MELKVQMAHYTHRMEEALTPPYLWTMRRLRSRCLRAMRYSL